MQPTVASIAHKSSDQEKKKEKKGKKKEGGGQGEVITKTRLI